MVCSYSSWPVAAQCPAIQRVVIKELLGHAHIGVTAGVYAHVRLRLQRQAIDTLGNALRQDVSPGDTPLAAAPR
ncbi:integrase [Streptomyces sp. AM 3-1-1]|uniref:integrase n=1 Tax=Streptomyces evansiae TaxID=3075535 RepID=UPI0023B8BEB1|nr:integrase [Streptomyces sp. AM 3-1-1]WEH28919.1 integrase [Streptomyces sp. AM 3-1-1]